MRKQHWIAVAVVLLLLALLGRACSSDDTQTRPSPHDDSTDDDRTDDDSARTGTVTDSSDTFLYVRVDDDDRKSRF